MPISCVAQNGASECFHGIGSRSEGATAPVVRHPVYIVNRELCGSEKLFRARVKWAAAGFRLVVVRKRVLLPFTVTGISVEAYVGMNRHSVIGHHALMNALADGGCDRLRGCRINEKSS